MSKTIYLDHSATTRIHPEVKEAMMPCWDDFYGNPSSLHHKGREARQGIESARATIAGYFNCDPKEIIFTSGGTESDNLAIFGVAKALKTKGNHIITSAIEHHAVLNTCSQLKKEGSEVTFLPVDKFGLVSLEELKKSIRPETILISIMYANNETGVIQPVEEIGRLAREHKIVFHTDAVQGIGKIKIDLNKLPVDLMTGSAHKIYGPKGIGLLYIRKGTRLLPSQVGGHHEFKRRAGTENVAGIIGFAKAVELAHQQMDTNNKKTADLRDRLQDGIVKNIPEVQVNGHPTARLPNLLNISFKYVEGEGIILNLDTNGICVSSGSACTSESLEPSHVLGAMGLPAEDAHGSIRFSLGLANTAEEIDFTVDCLIKTIDKLRQMSPLYKKK
ncbi:MAG: cysteine desulfurase NifS [Planctomycetota bacterium]